jgi:hypothetical protein
MILVIAGRYDASAQALVTRWASHDAHLVTCNDLSMRGWCSFLGASHASHANIGGHEVPSEEINGILTRLSCIAAYELLHIVPEDRVYVATEMNAFLTSWLAGFRCPVLNRPTPTCLSGPGWRREQWCYAAAQVGIPVHPVRRSVVLTESTLPETTESGAVMVTVVGDRCFGSVEPVVACWARSLAKAASTDLLGVQFSSPEASAFFVGAEPWPSVDSDDITDAILDYFQCHSCP